jgi:hypothetical protein
MPLNSKGGIDEGVDRKLRLVLAMREIRRKQAASPGSEASEFLISRILGILLGDPDSIELRFFPGAKIASNCMSAVSFPDGTSLAKRPGRLSSSLSSAANLPGQQVSSCTSDLPGKSLALFSGSTRAQSPLLAGATKLPGLVMIPCRISG